MTQVDSFRNLIDVLRLRAAETPGRPLYTFLVDGEEEAESLTAAGLERAAGRIAAALATVAEPGDRALLLFPPGIDFIAAFFGCFYAGVVAVPAQPPQARRDAPRLRAIARDAAPRVVLTSSSLRAAAASRWEEAPELAGAAWLATDALPESGGWSSADPPPDAVAFLQYTSGSTALPKGVMVSHANLLHNERMIRAAFGQDERSVVVGWLPLYHDMGLIGNLLQPLFCGGRCVLMSPVAFLQRPRRWLEAISRYRATTSGGPNFAYELCVRRVPPEERAGLDLASWRVAYNGAEPVRAETLDRFAEAFAGSGFRRDSFYPCYGLAEATLFVAGGVAGRGFRTDETDAAALERHEAAPAREGFASRRLVGCGTAWEGQRIAVADPESGCELPAGRIGEIWVSGPSVALGYWQRPEQTARDFRATLAGEADGPRFLRTGDLGFIADGELFVTGRLKDLVILRGRNHYPQDLELTAERCHPALRSGAAFSVDVDGEERLVLVCEVERRPGAAPETIAGAVRRAVAEEHEAQVFHVVLVRAATIPKTSSGKIQRHACRAAYLAGELAVVGESALPAGAARGEGSPPDGTGTAGLALLEPLERRAGLLAELVRRASRLLGGMRLDPARPLTELGLDSLGAVELKTEVEADLGLPVPLAELSGGCSLEDLADLLVGEAGAGGREESAPPVPLKPLDPAMRRGSLPLTVGQKALWFLERLAPETAAYTIAAAARLPDGADSEALRRAFQALVDRHAALRTTFAEGPDGPRQQVAGAAEVAFRRVDAAGWEAGELRRRSGEEAFRPFDLESGPLFRVTLFSRGQDGGRGDVLVLSVHHLVADLWSLTVLARDLAAMYGAAAAAAPPVLELEYGDFAVWQERALAAGWTERHWEYWRERLTGMPALDLPADRTRPAMPTHRALTGSLRLEPALAADLRGLARGTGGTLYMVLLAGFQALLGRYSGQDDFPLGSPTAGRSAVAGGRLADLVGYFVNPVVLRADLTGDPEVGEWLRRVRRTALGAFEHQDFPYPWLAERLQAGVDRAPLLRALFAFEKAPDPALEPLAAFALGEADARLALGGLILESMALPAPAAQFDLSLLAAELAGGIAVLVQLDADLFDPATAARIPGHFAALLRGLAAAPEERRISELPLLSEPELRQLAAWDAESRHAYPPGETLHGLFARQALLTPEAAALVAGGERVTYAELARRSGRLAAGLRDLGVGPETAVGVCMERTAGLVSALLGVLRAGGFYVPLDPRYPAERLSFLVTDSGARWVIVDDAAAERVPAGPRRLRLEDLERGEGASGGAEAAAENLAYLIYTSGSTGRPKGVAIAHRSAVLLVRWARETFGDDLQGLIAPTSVTFDLSVFEIFAPLACGGTVILARDALAVPEVRLPEGVEARLLNTVPSAAAELARLCGVPATVGTVCLAGEALTGPVVEALYGLGTVERIFNLYGPSEDTTYSTGTLVARGTGRPSIGRPLPGTRAAVVDRRFGRLPVGVPGELCLAGEGLARGYLGRPELTAERFAPDPFASEPGGRMYRTGDLVRRLEGGSLDFLGRIDHQVKVRGFRIEPGEIEARLAEHGEVREAAVLVQEEASGGGKRLVACIVPAPGKTGLAERLRSYLAERLPEPMVPSAWVELAALPRTPNGKLDRRELARVLPEPRAAAAGAPPRTPVEELLAGIWAEVLGIGEVGRTDSFFQLGGHSLLATQVMSRVRRSLGVELPLRALFEAPTLAALGARVERALRRGTAELPPLAWADRSGPLPLSFAQERLWFLHQLEPGGTAYNVPGAVFLRGRLDVAALAASLTEIARRHEALRTRFPAAAGRPVQEIAPPAPLPLPLVDLSALPAERREGEVRERLAAEAAWPFDLARGPVARALLLRLGMAEHALAVTLHHIVSDGWSLGVLVDEVSALYGALAAGRPSPLPELPVQYADFAVWQRGWLAGGALERQLAYWRERLAGAPQILDLPYDRPPSAADVRRGGDVAMSVAAGVTAGLREVAWRRGGTLFMVLLASFQALLSRVTGQEDLLVGSPVANRTRVEIEGLLGCFVNTLVLRAALTDDPTFGELLERAREATLQAYTHQDVPFERLVEELAPERDLSRPPLVQALLVLQNAPLRPLELPGLVLEPAAAAVGLAKFELTLSLTETADGLAGLLVYPRVRFDPATARRLLRHLEALLAAAAADPGRRLSELPLLAEVERHQLLREWNDTAAVELAEGLLHGLFEAQVGRTPEAVAVESAAGALTYRELDRRAAILAGRLAAEGVGPEEPVAVCVERSAEMVVAALGVLKAGAAYVPLDPGYPAARLALLLKDSGARWLLTQEKLLGGLPASGAAVLCLDRSGEVSAAPPGSAPLPRLSPDGMAYVIYTSGSAGRPKAVVTSHRGACNRLRWGQALYPLDGCDRVLQTASFSFDFSVWEIFAPLAAGAAVVLPEPGAQQEPARLIELIVQHGVTVAHFVPSFLAVFLDMPGVERCGSLRLVFSGGEALAGEVRDRFVARCGARLCNQYGPTEASIDVSFHLCAPEERRRSVSIGRPIANVALHVLDRWGSPLPCGVAGELLVGGMGLARGYLGRPELTAERFVPDPFGAGPGHRLYRTGDLVRRSVDGSLEFLGRIDQQVKIRGFRIELGEIEAALAGHAAVREAAVAVQPGAAGGRLVACVVPVAGEAGIAGRLRSDLAMRLPEHLLPSGFVEVAALPRTPGGKLDRRTLIRLVSELPAAAGPAGPRTPFEELLATLWAEVLRLDGGTLPGPEDDFFALGGHSLLAIRLIAGVRAACGVELPVREVFLRPTLGAMACRIEESLSAGRITSVPPILRVPHSGELPLSFAQERLWFLHQLAPESTAYSGPGCLVLSGCLDTAALAASLGEVVRRHAVLRTTFATVEGRPVQVVGPAGRLELPLVDLGGVPDPEREACRLAAAEAARPFDLARGPLFRLVLVRLSEGCHHLIFNVHHIVSDGWSTGVMVRELGSLYTSLSQRRPVHLPELPVQYADFAVWQRAWLTGSALAPGLAYWKRRLAGDLPVLRLPLPAPPEGTPPGGARRVLPLAPELSLALAELSRREGVTLFMALLAGFKVLLYRYTGLTDIAVGSAVAGRGQAEVEGLVGFFVNMLVMRTDLSGGPRFRDVLARVREVALGAFAHQEIPFEKLVEELGERSDRLPFQIAFGLQSASAERLELPALTLGVAAAPEVVPRFDLTVWVLQESGGLRVAWTYRTDVFTPASVDRMHGHYERLLHSAVQRPDERIHRLEMLTGAERAESEAEDKARERRQVEQLFSVRRRGVVLPRAAAPADRKGIEG